MILIRPFPFSLHQKILQKRIENKSALIKLQYKNLETRDFEK